MRRRRGGRQPWRPWGPNGRRLAGTKVRGSSCLGCHRLEVLNIQATRRRGPVTVGALEDGGAVLELFAHSRHFAFFVCWCVCIRLCVALYERAVALIG